MKRPTWLVPSLVVIAVTAVVVWAGSIDRSAVPQSSQPPDHFELVARIDDAFQTQWKQNRLHPADLADELTVLRRLSLALHGTIPSLQEIRQFESDDQPDRLLRWTHAMLGDPRFADYFAERLARSFVGVDDGQFILYRRDRFVGWLSEQLRENAPFDELVRQMISQDGLWTGDPAVNFTTAALTDSDFDENKLAGKTVRAFLGQRMDCAQCHDHPFDDWTQSQFEGLAAYYGQASLSLVGVNDKMMRGGQPVEYKVQDRMTLQDRTVPPSVPFGSEWLPSEGSRREKLAAWVTHPENRRFERAIVNRMWGLLFGRAYYQPVDDIPSPSAEEDLLDLLGKDFREHGYDLRRLILAITASRPFRASSTIPESIENEEDFWRHESAWAVFPVTRLRPEQVIGSALQASSLKTINQQSNLPTRTFRFFRERDFVNSYGDLGADELGERAGTISQALLRMNGRLFHELSDAGLMTAAGRIATTAGSDDACVETLFLACLSRRPTQEELMTLAPQLEGKTGDSRLRAVEDIVWPLYNSEEFSWNH